MKWLKEEVIDIDAQAWTQIDIDAHDQVEHEVSNFIEFAGAFIIDVIIIRLQEDLNGKEN